MKMQDLLLKMSNAVQGDFNDLSKFDFKGVYVICDKDEVVYVGSAYARTIAERLKQYNSKSDAGNTLGKSVAKCLSGSCKYDDSAKTKIGEAIDKIRGFSIYAFEHKDLEYQLIELAKPIYNNYGKGEDWIMSDSEVIDLYKKDLEVFLATLGIFKGKVIVNKDKKLNEENSRFIKNKYIQMKSGNVNKELLDIATNELIPYLFQSNEY